LLGLWPFFAFLWFWSWVELLCFFLSSYFLSLNLISRCVLSMHSSRGRLRTRSVPVVDGWPLLSDEWLTAGVGLTLGSVRRYRLRPSSCCCRWRTGAKGLRVDAKSALHAKHTASQKKLA
jgi:hypothetical protein